MSPSRTTATFKSILAMNILRQRTAKLSGVTTAVWYAATHYFLSVLVPAMHAKGTSVLSVPPAPAILDRGLNSTTYAGVVVTRLGCHTMGEMCGILGG